MDDKCAACPHDEHSQRVCGAAWDSLSRCECTEWRPGYILAMRAQALDEVQEIIEQVASDGNGNGPTPLPTQEQWEALVDAAFPPPPMAGA